MPNLFAPIAVAAEWLWSLTDWWLVIAVAAVAVVAGVIEAVRR